MNRNRGEKTQWEIRLALAPVLYYPLPPLYTCIHNNHHLSTASSITVQASKIPKVLLEKS